MIASKSIAPLRVSGAFFPSRRINTSSEVRVAAKLVFPFRAISTSPPTVTITALAACFAEAAASGANSASCYNRVENIRVLAIVKAKRELVQIQREIVRAYLVVGANHATLEQRPERFNRVCVDRSDHILLFGMVDGLVIVGAAEIPVGTAFIGRQQARIARYRLAHEIRLLLRAIAGDRLTDHVPLASYRADHGSLAGIGSAAPRVFLAILLTCPSSPVPAFLTLSLVQNSQGRSGAIG